MPRQPKEDRMTYIKRRHFIVAMGGLVLVPLAKVEAQVAQAPTAVPRVVLLLPGSMQTWSDRTAAFKQRLGELGYVESRNLILDIRELEGNLERLSKVMIEIVQTNPKVIVVSGSQSVRAAMAATADIAIVAATVGDPVEQGFAVSLARPGRNLTGNALIQDVSDQKTVEILHEIVPGATRVAFLTNPVNPISDRTRKRNQVAAEKQGLNAIFVLASSSKAMPQAFTDAKAQRAEILIVGNDVVLNTYPKIITDLAARHGIPAIYGNAVFPAEGGLVSYAFSSPALFRNAATFVDRILKGGRPGELPFEQPTEFELIINLKTAKALGIKIPDSIMVRATKVIE
jgi:ABC-type uncharacterized transport system substrate-binding protein